MTDRIEKTIELKAPISRVWRALTDHREFSACSASDWTGHLCRGRFRGGR